MRLIETSQPSASCLTHSYLFTVPQSQWLAVLLLVLLLLAAIVLNNMFIKLHLYFHNFRNVLLTYCCGR